MKHTTRQRIRKAHRYLGLFLGFQFLLWTISGFYFSWTDIHQIHGDHFKKEDPDQLSFDNLVSPNSLDTNLIIKSIALRQIAGEPYYWINNSTLYNAHTRAKKSSITIDEARLISQRHMKEDLLIDTVILIQSVDPHHEYRERLLPAYVISYEHDHDIKTYVSAIDGKFQTVRHRNWRWFDWLWMTHTMDYESRDNFNTTVLRAFSLLGIITVLSGFTLFFVSSPTLQKIISKIK